MSRAEEFFKNNSHYISDVEMSGGKIYYSRSGVIEMMEKFNASERERELPSEDDINKKLRKIGLKFGKQASLNFGAGINWIINKLKS